MSSISPPSPVAGFAGTVADLLQDIGGVAANRVLMVPMPGTATEKDLLQAEVHHGRICELVYGVLVEKTMGAYESAVAASLIYYLKEYLRRHRIGVVLGEAGFVRTVRSRVRAPDVSFISRERLGVRRLSRAPISAVAPDLAVEVLSKGNTRREMQQKLREYFEAGTRLVWHIDPARRTAWAYTAPDQREAIGEDGSLQGSDVLPGFDLPLRDLFAEAEETGAE